jgi:uncharacterized protein (TIRG00374 family)
MIRHLLLLMTGLALFAIFLSLGGLAPLEDYQQTRWQWVACAAGLSLPISALATWRWRLLTRALVNDPGAGWFAYYRCFIVARAVALILPKEMADLGGRALWQSRAEQVSLPAAGFTVAVDRLFDVILLPALLIATGTYWLGWLGAEFSIYLTVGLGAVFGSILVFRFATVLRRLERILAGAVKITARIKWLRGLEAPPLGKASLKRSMIGQVYCLTVLKYTLTILQQVLLANALNLAISPAIFALAAPLGQLSFLVAVTPGALGIFEAGSFAALTMLGTSTEQASAIVTANRLLMFGAVSILALMTQLLHLIFLSRSR